MHFRQRVPKLASLVPKPQPRWEAAEAPARLAVVSVPAGTPRCLTLRKTRFY